MPSENSTSFGGWYCRLACCRQHVFPDVLRVAENRGGEAAHLVLRCALAALLLRLLIAGAAAGHHLGAADQDARIDAEGPADQAEDHDGADAETAGAARACPCRGDLRHSTRS